LPGPAAAAAAAAAGSGTRLTGIARQGEKEEEGGNSLFFLFEGGEKLPLRSLFAADFLPPLNPLFPHKKDGS
jgi:hypothetical protein